MESLPRTAKVRTYSEDGQTTDSAPSMAAYMTGVKMKNEVISMTSDTIAYPTDSTKTVNNCASHGANGAVVETLLELAKAKGKAVGAVTTTRVTHATPATTYAHICHRDLENDIAIQVTPGGAGYNDKLGTGLDVLMGGGLRHFVPKTTGGSKRVDDRDLTAELTAAGYSFVTDKAGLAGLAVTSATRVLGLFNMDHLEYEIRRPNTNEPSLAEMTTKAIDILSKKPNGYFLVVEGGRIDHALHANTAIRAVTDTVAFDDAIQAALDKVDLSKTLIVVTADHDHTMIINGYSPLAGPTTPTNPGILGLVKDLDTGALTKDQDDRPFTILGFGNGNNRVEGARSIVTALTEAITSVDLYKQEAAVLVGGTESETHGSGDVMLMAAGAGSAGFKGTMVNTKVFTLVKKALGF